MKGLKSYFSIKFSFSVLYLFLTGICVFFISSCSPTKSLKNDQYLLNRINIENEIKEIDNEELFPYLKQKPNTRLLGLVRNRLFFYNLAYHSKYPKLWRWLKNSSEAPVIFDSLLTERSRNQLELFVHSKGYFNSSVSDSISISGNQKINVHFKVSSSTPYTIRNISYSIPDPQLNQIVTREIKHLSLLKTAENYDMENLQKERDRITKDLRNRGFYYFSKEYIYYKVDSNLNNRQVDIVLGIKNVQTDEGEQKHERYYINKVYIQPDYNFRENTIRDSLIYKDYYFISRTTLKYKAKAITRNVFYKKDDLFKLDKLTLTYNRLSNLNVFKSVTIRFENTVNDTIGNKQLNCFIELTPAPTNAFSIEIEGTHNTTNSNGIAGSFVFKNKNLFKGAEIFEFKIKGAMQVQKTQSDSIIEGQEYFNVFNTIEVGPEVNITFPRFLLPFNSEKFSQSFNPKTTLSSSFTFQKRVDYKRQMASLSLTYNWKESEFKTHAISVPSISYIKVDTSSLILKTSDIENNILLKSQFSDQFIVGAKYSFTFNNQQINKPKDFVYFRGNLELAGNALRGLSGIVGSAPNDYGQYHLLGIEYAQYVIPDIEFKYYNIINPYNTIVYRFIAGIGIPYKNSYSLPFVKSFSAGGPNDLRAWKAYTLGPGAYHSTVPTQVGDVKLEANIEYRFDIYKYLEGALFIDAGNVWLMNKDELRPSADFDFIGSENFIDQTAIGGGLGIRIDLSFVIVRFDAGVPLRTPYLPDGKKWLSYTLSHPSEYPNVWKNEFFDKINFSIGIGYPF